MATVPSNHLQSSPRTPPDPFTDPATAQRRPPPLPPKSTAKSPHMHPPGSKSVPAPRDAHPDLAQAIRDTVVVRPSPETKTRSRVGRSHTAQTPSPAARPTTTRSHSQDSANTQEKSKTSSKGRSKKGSQHADVIDRLDFTGVGPMFHHDGPFDACAPSRNRQRNKAPMFAWNDDPLSHGNSAYPSADAYKAFSGTTYVDPPKKKVDAIAEAWGIHEPEPYEEFFAGGGAQRTPGATPASSIYNGRDSHNSSTSQTRPSGPTRRPLAPPPKPIDFPDASNLPDLADNSPPRSPGFPQRTKSLMHRIRKMRDAPNVPVGPDYEPAPASPTEDTSPGTNGSRPTHRSQNSFLGRLSGSNRNNNTTPDKSEPFIYIEANTKELPATPRSRGNSTGDAPPDGAIPSSPGLARKTSIMKKVGRVVVGRNRQ